jgi:hypothetical protein
MPSDFAPPAFSGMIGIAREEITPPSGIYARNWGAARTDTAKGIHLVPIPGSRKAARPRVS